MANLLRFADQADSVESQSYGLLQDAKEMTLQVTAFGLYGFRVRDVVEAGDDGKLTLATLINDLDNAASQSEATTRNIRQALYEAQRVQQEYDRLVAEQQAKEDARNRQEALIAELTEDLQNGSFDSARVTFDEIVANALDL